MGDGRVGATLKYGGKPVPAGPTAPVDASGLTVALDVPADVELLRASLTLQAPGDDVMVDLPPTATIATSLGPGPAPANTAINWISLDWGARRPLTFLQIKTTDTGKEGRVSVAEGGPWFPPTPGNTVALGDNAGQSLPGVMASRLLVEFFTTPANPFPPDPNKKTVAATVSALVVKASARPPDLTALVEPEQLFFHHAMPLQPLQELTLRDELRDALQRAWPANLRGGPVTLTLRSSAPSRLRRLALTLDTVALTRKWSPGGESLTLPLSTDGEGVGRIEVPPDRPLREVLFLARYQPRGERIPLVPQAPAQTALAHRCGSGYAAAQAFSPPGGGGALAGIDLHLRPLTRSVKGTLTLFPDEFGRPGKIPLGAAVELSLEEQGNAPWASRWVSFELPRPVELDAKANWWAVLAVTEGNVLWSLGDAATVTGNGGLAPRVALYRAEDTGPWLEREVPSTGGTSGGPWAISRPRLLASPTEPPAPPQVLLRWGSRQLAVVPDAQGRVSLDERALAALPPPGLPATGPAPVLEVVVRAQAAGELTLSELRVTSPRSDTYPLFQPS
ncbi:hypothetical protein JY651_50480 [Pyxidicoccus parkwayensis]|uniref:Lipoprotein n=1 Tax=Pyxidicoccus parkwayensis TaxID=2813578 RepID=A0ABX7NXN5_9BACT|nr:hypothetical protein [Pyxidicoccus parkwaysis]QSQ23218.1 hypothetical protein JY651_50480 [Pyxidicoccus parkwaysis]